MDRFPTREEIREEIRTSPKHTEFRRNFKIDAAIGIFLSLAGLFFIGWYSHWAVVGGIVLVHWGRNVMINAGKRPEKREDKDADQDNT